MLPSPLTLPSPAFSAGLPPLLLVGGGPGGSVTPPLPPTSTRPTSASVPCFFLFCFCFALLCASSLAPAPAEACKDVDPPSHCRLPSRWRVGGRDSYAWPLQEDAEGNIVIPPPWVPQRLRQARKACSAVCGFVVAADRGRWQGCCGVWRARSVGWGDVSAAIVDTWWATGARSWGLGQRSALR